jgi:hypothetical protein
MFLLCSRPANQRERAAMSAQSVEAQTAVLGPIILTIVQQALDALPILPGASEDQKKLRRDAARMMIGMLCPLDPEQTATAVQIVTLHFMAMECFRRAAQPDLPDRQMLQLLGKANALLRQHIRTLREYRRNQGPLLAGTRQTAPAPAAQPSDQPNPGENRVAPMAADKKHLPDMLTDPTVLDLAAATALHKETTGMQKVLRQMAARGVTNGFRPGKLKELAARAAR